MKKYYWLALGANGCNWDQCQQIPVYGTWEDAVKTAKAQNVATRLSDSKGFRNQGHYFQPEIDADTTA